MTDQTTQTNPEKAPEKHGKEMTPEDIITVLQGYRKEAEDGRRENTNNRDEVWEDNIDLFWNRFDFDDKAEWQATEVIPAAPQFVNRFAAAMQSALTKDGEFFTIEDPADPNSALTPAIKKMMEFWLSRCSHNATGHPVEFSVTFGDLMKLSAMMASASTVTWKERRGKGYVAFDIVDPRMVFLDPTGRGLYRIIRRFIDKHELEFLAGMKDGAGNKIYDTETIQQLQANLNEEEKKRQRDLSGHGTEDNTSTRQPIQIDEYLCDLVDSDGNIRYTNHLFVVANNKFLIRGPEANPWWHEHDWLVYAPSVTVPLSVYGKTYMEDWSKLARTFNEMTNLIIDAVHTNSINAFVGKPTALEDPNQLEEGIHPSKIFYVEENEDPRQVLQALELGNLPPEAITLWQALKKELQEGAMFSEIALGQLSRGEKTATEISESQQGSQSALQSIAKNVETGHLEPTLALIWMTGLQHLKKNDPEMQKLVGEEMYNAIYARRKEFIKKNVKFKVNAISGLLERNEKFRKLMNVLQIIATNELLVQSFVQMTDPQLLIRRIFNLIGFDLNEIIPNQQQSQVSNVVEGLNSQADAANEAALNAPPQKTGSDVLNETIQAITPLIQQGSNGQSGQGS